MAERRARRRQTEPRRATEIADVTLTLLAENGYEDLTVEAVAERSGVNKTTIYRWWPSKATLVAEAMRRSNLLGFEPTDTGSTRGDLRELIEHVVRLLTTAPTAQVTRTLLVWATLSPDLGEQTREFFADHLALDRVITERAVARGDLASRHADPAVLVDLLLGAVWMRCVIRREPIDEGFADEILDTVLDGARDPRGQGRRA